MNQNVSVSCLSVGTLPKHSHGKKKVVQSEKFLGQCIAGILEHTDVIV